jgi:hypothetical protein
MLLAAALLALSSAAGCGEKKGDGQAATPEAKPSAMAAVAPPPSAAPTTQAAAAVEPAKPADTGTATAPAGTTTPTTAPVAAGTGAPTAGPAPTGSAAAGPKTFDCGAKGQKPCPMQGWMKSVMASATSSGDATKIANALAYTAGKPPPGMGSWVAISNEGVAKAKAGDIDGAKASCKKCHDLYKEKYKTTMRDRPW